MLEEQIQMVDLHGQYLRFKEEIDEAMQAVIDSCAFINGPQVKSFAGHLADYLQVPYVIPCGNGTDALQIALMALELQPGDEVILPAFTYIAAAEVVALLGLTPVLVDVDPPELQYRSPENRSGCFGADKGDRGRPPVRTSLRYGADHDFGRCLSSVCRGR